MANDNDKKSIDLTLTPDDQPETAPEPQEDLTDKDLDTTGVEIHTDESSAEVTAVKADYGAEQIQILEGLEAVRMRPGMYIGSTSERACIISSTRSSTTPSMRPWPATATILT